MFSSATKESGGSSSGRVGRMSNRRPKGLFVPKPGVTVNGLVRWTINHGFAGLERWAGTPGTIGGGIAGNAHFGGHLLGDLVDTVRVATLEGRVLDLRQDEMEFGYDRSRLQRTREVLLWASFRVGRGEPAELRAGARASLAHRKRTQPLDVPSAGCIFQNPSESRGSFVGYRRRWCADRSGGKEGSADRRCVCVNNPRELHRERGRRLGAGHPCAHRRMPDCCERAVWDRAAGRDCVSRRVLEKVKGQRSKVKGQSSVRL